MKYTIEFPVIVGYDTCGEGFAFGEEYAQRCDNKEELDQEIIRLIEECEVGEEDICLFTLLPHECKINHRIEEVVIKKDHYDIQFK